MPQFMLPRQKMNKEKKLKTGIEDTICFEETKQVQEENRRELKETGLESRIVKLSRKYKKPASKLLKIAEENIHLLEKLLGNSVEEITIMKSLSNSEHVARYPRRNIERKSYVVEGEIYEEQPLSCGERRSCEEVSPARGSMLFMKNSEVKLVCGNNRNEMSCPPFLFVGASGFKRAGFGVWTKIEILKGAVFGPYMGTISTDLKDAQKGGYAWQLRKCGSTHRLIEGSSPSESNWMQFVSCAVCEEDQNLVALQFREKIYYRTCKNVRANTELLVWNGSESATSELATDLVEKAKHEKVSDGCFECEVCHLLLSTESCLFRHRKTHPHQERDRKHTCSFCPYSTFNKSHIQKHLRTHTKEKPFLCEECGRKFNQSSHLQMHHLVHSEEKPFRCEECGQKFNRKDSLSRHERIHSDFRPFICSTCRKRYSHKFVLDKHELIHNGQKPHKCSGCGYRAAQLIHLQKHVIAVHTKEYPHVCEECGKGFVQKSHLKLHVGTKHKAQT